MKIFQASFNEEILLAYNDKFPDRKPNVLISFGILNRNFETFLEKHRDKVGMIILDCGAWTLNNSTGLTHICLDSYMRYLKRYGCHFDYYFNLDSDFEPTGYGNNIFNQKRMEDAGLRPVPVIHDLYGPEIDYYIQQKYPIVAIGSKQSKNLLQLHIAVKKIYRAGIKVHLFGSTSYELITGAPIFFCDSSSWAQTGAFGHINYWNPQKMAPDKTDRIYIGEYIKNNDKDAHLFMTYKHKAELKEYLKSMGITYADLMGKGGALCKQIVNLHYYMTLEQIASEKHRKLGYMTE